MVTRTLTLGAAGRDFHNVNVVYRDHPAVEVVAFTATQISGIAGRRYPPALAGRATLRASRSCPKRSSKHSAAAAV